MAKPVLGRPVEYDWERLRAKHEKSGLTLKLFCEQEKLSYTNTSKEFSALEKEEVKDSIWQFQKILAKKLPDMARGLAALASDEDKNIQLKAIIAAADRSGLSPQAVNIQVSNTTNTLVLATPIFASASEPAIGSFLGADIEASPDKTDD